MMTNLFSTFDPSTSMLFAFNWLSTLIILLILPNMFWLLPNRINMLMNFMTNILYMEFKTLIGKKNQGLSLMLIGLFMFILVNNLMGLLPYIFTSSSHLSYTLSLAIPMWIALMMFGWINKTQMMFAHLSPSGTPPILMPFMILIETISNMIRPGSLAVRLTANMIAGHLLMSLLGNNMTNPNPMMIMIILIQSSLMMFEIGVSIIQAYVFSILTALYSSEVN